MDDQEWLSSSPARCDAVLTNWLLARVAILFARRVTNLASADVHRRRPTGRVWARAMERHAHEPRVLAVSGKIQGDSITRRPWICVSVRKPRSRLHRRTRTPATGREP